MYTFFKACLALSLCGLLVFSPHVSAQEGGSNSPDTEVTNYKDWSVRCITPKASPSKRCVMLQRLALDSGQLLMSVQLLKQVVNKESENLVDTLILSVPWGVHLKPGLRVRVDDGKSTKVAYERCDPKGCYAGLVVDAEMLQSMMRGNKANVTFVEPAGKGVTVPVSLAGFTAAYRALP